MPRFIMRKRLLLPGGVVAVLLLAGAALAYFTSTGSGSATATVGNSSAVTLHATVASSMYPGASSSVSFTVDNPSPGSERVATIHLQSVSVDAGHSACVTADFTMPDVTVNQTFPNGNGQAVTATGTLTMANTGVSQNACQGATLTLSLTST
jgi:hypothetical protein